jgi:FtsH-binding integral membrane protein
MSNYDPNYAAAQRGVSTDRVAAEIDQGLRSHMLKVYNYMALGVAGTALVTLFLMNNPALLRTLVGGPMIWVWFIAILGLGFLAPRLIFSRSTFLAHLAFWAYAALWGVIISPMILRFFAINAGDLVFRAFAITALTFGATSLYGYVTKRDLTGFSSFFVMGSIGLLIAIVVNALFFKSTMMSFVTSSLVVLLFAGVTAWETQQIKEMYYENDGTATLKSKAIMGAFMLYGSFVTLFVHILNILGIMRGND